MVIVKLEDLIKQAKSYPKNLNKVQVLKSVKFSEDVEADVSSSEEFLVPKLKFQIDEEVLEGVSREVEVPDASKGEVYDLDVVQALLDVRAQGEDLGAFREYEGGESCVPGNVDFCYIKSMMKDKLLFLTTLLLIK